MRRLSAIDMVTAVVALGAVVSLSSYVPNPIGTVGGTVAEAEAGTPTVTGEFYALPDRMGRVFGFCDNYGHRVFVADHTQAGYGITAVDDETCPVIRSEGR